MELLLSAISAGGLTGAANQYMCLILMAVAAKLGWVELAPPVAFMESWWFIAVVGVFWLLTIAPAYASLLSPGVMNVVNAVTNFLSGFLTPLSGALLTLAAVGVIAEMNPELYNLLQTLQIFDPTGQTIGRTGWLMAGGGALTATALGGAKFLAKPALSASTGATGHVSAPAYATVENAAAIVLMALAYLLTQINPWLLVALMGLVILIVLGALIWALYQLWKLGKGVGRAIRLLETHPRAGLAVVAEFFVWGSGWLLQQQWQRGVVRLVLWAIWAVLVFFVAPALAAAVGAALVAVPPLAFLASAAVMGAGLAGLMAGLYAGARSAGALLKTFDECGAPSPGAARARAEAS